MPRKLPPLNALRAFEAAARHSSFTRAAVELSVTHGAISQQIKVLEDYLHKPLFIRNKGRVEVNPAGQQLLPAVSEALDRIERSVQQLREDRRRCLCINLTTAFAGQWLIPRLNRFEQQHPDVSVQLAPSASFDGFRDPSVDVAIRWGTRTVADTSMEKLFDVDAFVACSPQLAATLSEPADLLGKRLIHDDDGSAWRVWLERAGIRRDDFSQDLYFSDSWLALRAATDSQGCILAGSILAAQDLAAGTLVIPFELILRKRNAYYLYHSATTPPRPEVADFCNWLREEAALYMQQGFCPETFLVSGPPAPR